MASLLKHNTPLYDPIKAQFAVLSSEHSFHKKAVLLEVLIKAAYKGETELNSSMIETIKGVEVPGSESWGNVNLCELDLNRLDNIIAYQKLFLHTEKDDISSTDYIIFSSFTLLADEFMIADVKLDAVHGLCGTTLDEILDTVEFLFEKGWLESTYDGYVIKADMHVASQTTGWAVKEIVDE